MNAFAFEVVRRGGNWNRSVKFRAREFESGCRTGARKLGLRGPILTRERVGSSQWAINVDGEIMMVVARPTRPGGAS